MDVATGASRPTLTEGEADPLWAPHPRAGNRFRRGTGAQIQRQWAGPPVDQDGALTDDRHPLVTHRELHERGGAAG